MGWVQLHVYTTPEQAEAIEDLMLELGAEAVSMDDAEDQPLYEPDLGTTPLWNSTRVTALFDDSFDMEAVQAAFITQWQAGGRDLPGEIRVEALEDKPWERAWMDDFKPMQFGRRLWICPSWHEPVAGDAVNLMLDPGLAFGTGTHPTTALCLTWLDGAQLEGQEVIDYGCGSGVLALAALLLGARRVVGVDTDPQALEASLDNAQRNGVDDRLALYLPADAPTEPADVLLANILAQPLIDLAPRLAGLVRSGGQIVLSGILAEQAEQVQQRYATWFTMDPVTEHNGWVRLSGIRKPDAA